MRSLNRHLGMLVVVVAGGIGVTSAGAEQAAQSVFTADQAAKGKAVYQERCASCHMPDLGGRNEWPQLAGDDFMGSWKSRTTKELFEFVRDTMPPDGPALTPEQYLTIVAFMLQQNGATAGSTALTPTTAVPIGSVATGKRPGAAVAHQSTVPTRSSRNGVS